MVPDTRSTGLLASEQGSGGTDDRGFEGLGRGRTRRLPHILAGHVVATRRRVAAACGTILVLQDTTEFVFAWAKPETIGAIGRGCTGRDRDGKLRIYTQCGLLMHASLVVTPEGLPLGLAAVKFWTRSKFKGTSELKRHVNPTRVSIEDKESMRWLENMRQSTALLGTPNRLVHIGDRESDIYELFCEASKLGTHFLVRTCVDRLAVDGKRTVAAEMGDSGRRPVFTGSR